MLIFSIHYTEVVEVFFSPRVLRNLELSPKDNKLLKYYEVGFLIKITPSQFHIITKTAQEDSSLRD